MNKSRQKELTRWLKQQSVISQRWLNISRLLGFVSGILIIACARFMARILQHMIMENIPREALLLPLYVTGSDLCTARMGGLVTRTGGLSRRAAYPLCHPPSGSRPSAKQGQRGFRVNLRGAGRRWYSSKLTICMITMPLPAANGAGSVGAVADCGGDLPL